MDVLQKILIFSISLLTTSLVVRAQDNVVDSVASLAEGDNNNVEYVYALPGVTKMFEIDDSFATSDDEITINPEWPDGLIYQIQALTLNANTNYARFHGLYPVFAQRGVGTKETRFYVGLFRKKEDATQALAQVKSKGFRDAFIVNRMAGQTVNASRAAEFEKDWADVPFSYSENGISTTVEQQDSVSAVLTYRVELLRTKIPAKSSEVSAMRSVAGNRSFDIYTLSDGNITYLIGSFITLESANDFANLVSRNGFLEASVTAWLGTMELPIETAQMLFNSVQ